MISNLGLRDMGLFSAALTLAMGLAVPTEAQDAGIERAKYNLYGSLRLGMGLLDDGDDRAVNVFDRGSRLGFEGTLTPGAGMPAATPEFFWQIEFGVDLDRGDGSLTGRDSFLGIRDEQAWGSLRIGFFDTPGKEVGRAAEQVVSRIGDQRNITRVDGVSGGQDDRTPGFDPRWGNGLYYATPRLAGFGGAVAVSTNVDDDFGNTTDTSPGVSAKVTYDQGPLYLGGAFETIDEESGVLAANEDNPKLFRVSGVYDMDPLVISAMFQRAEDQQGVSGQDRNVFGGGASYWFNDRTRLGGQVYRANDVDNLDDSSAIMVAGELEYRLYPQAYFYASVARTNNDVNANFQTARSQIGDGPLGKSSTSWSLLLRYDF